MDTMPSPIRTAEAVISLYPGEAPGVTVGGWYTADQLQALVGRTLVPFVCNWDAWAGGGRGGRRIELRYKGRYSGPYSTSGSTEEVLALAQLWARQLATEAEFNPRPPFSGNGRPATSLKVN